MNADRRCGGFACYCAARTQWEVETMTDDTPRHRRHREPPGRPSRAPDSERTIATVPRNAIEEIRVRLSRFKGYDFVDVRIFVEPHDSEERRPTKRGIALRVERLPELLEALREAERAARSEGLLDDDS